MRKSEPDVAADEVSRREFLRLAMMSSAIVMGAVTVLGGEQPTPHAQLRELTPGVVRPEGWLRGMLEKQAALLLVKRATTQLSVTVRLVSRYRGQNTKG